MPSGMGSPDLLELPCVEAVVSSQGSSHLACCHARQPDLTDARAIAASKTSRQHKLVMAAAAMYSMARETADSALRKAASPHQFSNGLM